MPDLSRHARGGRSAGASLHSPEDRLAETEGLAEAIDLTIARGLIVPLSSPKPGTLFGSGKVEELGRLVADEEAELVIVDHTVSPVQQRNLEMAWKAKVLDRTGLILEIFGRRARTREGRLQVELAHLTYQKGRLVRAWTHLERQRGGRGFLGGPGEAQIELDRRMLQDRIDAIRKELENVVRTRELHRAGRRKVPYPVVAIVGYTNAGKSTLLNRLTGSREFAADMLFATLDTRTRQWRLPDGRVVLLSDTVGFLERLPHHLVASFHATLEETLQADLLVHVVDASHPDARAQIAAVEGVLGELSRSTLAEILALNKVDAVAEPLALQLLARDSRAEVLHLSARTGEGLERLTDAVVRRLDQRSATVDVILPLADGRTAAVVRRTSAVLEEETLGEERLRLRVRLGEGALGNLRRLAGPEAEFRMLEEPALPRLAPDLP